MIIKSSYTAETLLRTSIENVLNCLFSPLTFRVLKKSHGMFALV